MESLPVLLLLSFIQAWLSFDLVLSGEENEVLSNDSVSKLLHLRVRRGWVWRKIFVEEEDPTPRTIGQLKSDLDEGDFSIQYVLSGEGAGEIFLIDEFTGDISSVKPLDREKKPFYTLQAQAISRRTHRPVEPESEFIIRVQDINDNTPEFVNEPYECSIPERSPTGTTVFQVSAHDADDPLFGSGAKLIFSILQGEPYFSVQPTTGVIVTTWSNLDREASETHLVLVQVKDQLGGAGAHSASTTVTVRLSDVNDNGPAFQRNLYWFAVSEGAAVGTVVGRIRAEDGDEGSNTEMIYNLKDPEESSTFSIHTDLSRQEGIITLRQPLDYESKRQFIIAVEAVNAYPDLRFLREDEFSDRTTVKISVTDEDEPPVFSGTPYLWKIQENVQMGTAVGKVLARDADVNCNPLRFRLSESSSLQRMFRIDPENGTVFVNSCLDRETQAWFNLTVIATETRDNRLQSAASLLISVLDVNDNQPRLAYDYQPHVCEDIGPGELVELLSATDADDPPGGHHFYFSMIPDKHINPNFTIRDNQDNTASILARRSHFSRDLYALYLLPVVIRDSGSPALSSTSTLSISVCVCQPETRSQCQSGATEKLRLLGTGTKMLIIALSLLSLSALLALALAVRKHRASPKAVDSPAQLKSEQSLELNVNFLDRETSSSQAIAFRRPKRTNRTEINASIRRSVRNSLLQGPDIQRRLPDRLEEDEAFLLFIEERLQEADADPLVPPFDCLHSYAFEGTGSSTGSLSSLDSFQTLTLDLQGEDSELQGCGSTLLTPDSNRERSGMPKNNSDFQIYHLGVQPPVVLRLSPWIGADADQNSF